MMVKKDILVGRARDEIAEPQKIILAWLICSDFFYYKKLKYKSCY